MSKIILLESIRSMQNVGAIFRNADGAGFDKLIMT
jgi:tRNA G18 (ribose-2'-O)-methylase SpoU